MDHHVQPRLRRQHLSSGVNSLDNSKELGSQHAFLYQGKAQAQRLAGDPEPRSSRLTGFHIRELEPTIDLFNKDFAGLWGRRGILGVLLFLQSQVPLAEFYDRLAIKDVEPQTVSSKYKASSGRTLVHSL